jgi:hypothetical protein
MPVPTLAYRPSTTSISPPGHGKNHVDHDAERVRLDAQHAPAIAGLLKTIARASNVQRPGRAAFRDQFVTSDASVNGFRPADLDRYRSVTVTT